MKSDQPLYIPSWIQSSRERDLKRFEVKLAEAQQRLKDRSKVFNVITFNNVAEET